MRFISTACHYLMNFLPARDAGQVLFFCGAGISLGSAMDSPARRLSPQRESLKKPAGLPVSWRRPGDVRICVVPPAG